MEPVFAPGPLLRLGKQGKQGRLGDLVTAIAGRGAPRIVAVHGPATSPRAAMAALLADEELGRPFPRAVTAEAEEVAATAGDPGSGRADLTDQLVITIDPEGAKDHDDAIAAVRDGDDIRLWVHIADVACFVAPGGAIDREAARRGNSVYVPGSVDPMLPRVLSNDVCSLRPGEDRSVVSVELVVARDGEVRATHFQRSTIHSRRRLTYPQVDAHFAGGSLDDPELEAGLAVAREAARRLRERRMARGALDIGAGEPSFVWDGDRLVGVTIEQQTESHRLIEDCMVAANEAVARYLLARGHAAVFRFHDDPAETAIVLLYDRLAQLGVAAPPLPDGPLTPTQCAQAARDAAFAIASHVTRHGGARGMPVLVLQALRQAYYSPDDPHHSGLASSAYLHFTSPIRRYPDLVVHRALLDALGLDAGAEDALGCAVAAEHSSITERHAQQVERRADRICSAFLVQELIGEDHERVFDGEVTGVGEAGVFVAFGPELAFDGYLPARSIPGDWWTQDPLGVMLEGDDTGRRIAVGDALQVRVVDVHPLRGRVELEPASAPARAAGAPGPRGRTRGPEPRRAPGRPPKRR